MLALLSAWRGGAPAPAARAALDPARCPAARSAGGAPVHACRSAHGPRRIRFDSDQLEGRTRRLDRAG
ncbi:MAG: hypothetical protein EOP19_20620 [Hyphomicrobiales bacterium]|nr:MAG: hypothetical protein EOP19_20620 [Hyphomicrobiales bacterium]